MSSADVVEYAKEKLDLFATDAKLECAEIGDGNLNYVFRVRDPKTDTSVIIKQAGDTARISDDFKLSTERIKIESEVLQLEGKLAPGRVPDVYFYDGVMNCCAMEDLSDYVILRQALIEQQQFPLFADHITTFLVNTLLLTSDVVLEHKQKKQMVKKYINPELCEITEDLVYTEPYQDVRGRNELFSPNREWIEREIYGDTELHLEAAKCKFQFMNHAQALIHGDLHTGSVFIRLDDTKVIDPEFAFYGPMGYDIGNVIANLLFAWAHANAIDESRQQPGFLAWIEQTVVEVIDQFKEKFLKSWQENATDVMAKESGFATWYLSQVIEDTAAVTGLEMIRRIVGLAKVKDITSIEDVEQRINAERICLIAAKRLIKERATIRSGIDFLSVFKGRVSQ
nr:S-methyl-5-thioribose kinase [Seinonella peptonophila]